MSLASLRRTSSIKTKLALSAYWLGLVLGTVWVLEFASQRILNAKFAHSLTIFDSIAPEAGGNVLGVKTNFSCVWTEPEFTVKVETDRFGFRKPSLEDPGAATIAVFGDSFTFGQGVQGEERYSSRLQELLPNEKVLNLSYPNGVCPLHFEVFFRAHAELKPRLAVVGLYLGNDFYSDPLETKVLAKDEEGPARIALARREVYQGVLINRPPEGANAAVRFLMWLRPKSATVRLVLSRINTSRFRDWVYGTTSVAANSPNPPQLDAFRGENIPSTFYETFDSLTRLRSQLRNRNPGAELLVLIIPQNFYVCRLPANVHTLLSREEVPELYEKRGGLLAAVRNEFSRRDLLFLDPTEELARLEQTGTQTYFERDAHWTPAVHKVIGEWLAKRIQDLDQK
jgi:hypothetical protein